MAKIIESNKNERRTIRLTTDDIIPASGNQKDGKVVQSAWMYPSKYEKDYLSLKDIPNAFKMEQFCEYIFEKAKSQ